VVEVGCAGSCSVVVLFSETDLEEPLTAGERTSRRGLIRRPKQASVQGGNSQSCTLDILFSRTALEEPFTTAGEFDPGLDAGDQGRPPQREGPRDDADQSLLFTGDGPGGAVVGVGGESPVLEESVRGTSVVEETEGREGRNS
jgi:hypothetical protein